MGLIKAAVGALGGTLADQWREYVYCDSLPENVLAAKGKKRTSDKRSSNTKGEDNILTNGSVIAVNEGQCMIVVDQGKVVELCAEAGEFIYDTSTEPSIFYGGLGKGLLNTFKTIGKRITFGGDTGKDQRVYYFNTKEILGNNTARPTRSPSAWSTAISGWTSTSASAAMANIRTGSPIRCCSIPTCAATSRRTTPATGWTGSSRPS